MSRATSLVVHSDASAFFREEISSARQLLGVELDEWTEYYLVNLLKSYMHPASEGAELKREPLFVLRQRALESPSAERIALLKQLGDEALYTSGFFAESIERTLVDLTYYETMGQGAYRELAALVGAGAHGDALQLLYGHLASDFVTLVDVLNQVASHAQQQTQDDRFLLKLYERYTRTKNVRVKKMLEGRGLIVPESDADDTGH